MVLWRTDLRQARQDAVDRGDSQALRWTFTDGQLEAVAWIAERWDLSHDLLVYGDGQIDPCPSTPRSLIPAHAVTRFRVWCCCPRCCPGACCPAAAPGYDEPPVGVVARSSDLIAGLGVWWSLVRIQSPRPLCVAVADLICAGDRVASGFAGAVNAAVDQSNCRSRGG